MDPKALLDRFLGPDAAAGAGTLADRARGALGGNTGAMLGGAAAGGLLALLLGSKKVRRMAGGAIGYGGAAALGALAYRAWQGWQQGTAPAAAPAAAGPPALPPPAFAATAPEFQLALIRAMAGAAMADGHVDAAERATIFAQVDRLGLDAEAKGFIFDLLQRPPSFDEIAAGAATQEQAAELYLAARLAIDPDHPAERAWLEALAHRLRLPSGLVAQLDGQAAAALGQ
ncbi:MAG: tellurite resistance TerB family protein [Acetobacteraceae bacterium]